METLVYFFLNVQFWLLMNSVYGSIHVAHSFNGSWVHSVITYSDLWNYGLFLSTMLFSYQISFNYNNRAEWKCTKTNTGNKTDGFKSLKTKTTLVEEKGTLLMDVILEQGMHKTISLFQFYKVWYISAMKGRRKI